MSQEPSGCSNQRPTEDLTVRVERFAPIFRHSVLLLIDCGFQLLH